jgi:hypothetical protein
MKRTNQTRRSKHRLTPAGLAMRRAAKAARKTARNYGTPIYVWRAGKVVAEKP